jgi:hypothetical protein
MMKPGWMPSFVFQRLSERRARKAMERSFTRDFPDSARRLQGIAKGAGVSLDALYLLTAMEAMMADTTNCATVPALGGCSAVAVRGGRSALGEPVILRNFDYMETVRPLYCMRRSQPATGFRSIEFTMAPFAGALDGVNEKGLCITYDYAYATDRAAPSAPISILIAEALQRCSTVGEAVAWIRSRPRWGAALLMLADAEGEVASLELSNTRAEVRLPAAGEDALFHSNTFWTASMREVQVSDQATFTDRAPRALRGRRLHESATRRDARFRKLLERNEPMDLDALGAIMADHGEDGVPSNTTICVHGQYWATTASLQLFPRSRCIRVAFDSACRARHTEIAL